MTSATYVRFELFRTFRNTRFFIFSLAFPVVLYVLITSGNRNVKDYGGTGLSFPLYYMVGMTAWGSMTAAIAGGARIAAERQTGWIRQLRLTPLRVPTYFGAKILSGYVVAATTMVVLFALGISFGVRMPLESWLRMTALILIGLVPFAALGIWMGHVLTIDSMGPALGGSSSLFALLGGAWFPLGGTSGFLHQLTQLIPSYWLVQAAHSAFTGQWWPAKAWLVMIVWSLVFIRLGRRAYVRDTMRV
jgi:ABC-2 type transport system permease protein